MSGDGAPGSAGQRPVTLTLSKTPVSRNPLLREHTAKPTSSVLFIVMLTELRTVQLVPSSETEPVKTFPARVSFCHSGNAPVTLVVPELVPLPPVELR